MISAPTAIIFSAFVAITLGIIGWRENRRVARETAAFSLIVEREQEYRAEFRGVTLLLYREVNVEEISEHIPQGKEGASWKDAIKEGYLPEAQKQNLLIARLLNFYEAVAIAIFEKIVDEKTVKRFLVGRLCWHIEKLYPFIQKSRGKDEVGDDRVWVEAEKLARRWGANIPPPSNEKFDLSKVFNVAMFIAGVVLAAGMAGFIFTLG